MAAIFATSLYRLTANARRRWRWSVARRGSKRDARYDVGRPPVSGVVKYLNALDALCYSTAVWLFVPVEGGRGRRLTLAADGSVPPLLAGTKPQRQMLHGFKGVPVAPRSPCRRCCLCANGGSIFGNVAAK